MAENRSTAVQTQVLAKATGTPTARSTVVQIQVLAAFVPDAAGAARRQITINYL